jgi:predicted ATPase
MLSDEEKIVWRRISVFHGPFTIDAVDRVAHDRQTEHFNTGVILEKFGRKITGFSRLKRGEAVRYRLLESLRLYALNNC